MDRILGSRFWDLLITKLGIGTAVIALFGWGWAWFKKRKDRGRKLVDEARPELAPIGNLTPRGQFCLNVQNRGPGRSYNLRLRFTGTPGEAAGGEVAPNQTSKTPTLDVSRNPGLTTAQPGPLALTIVYADRFGNDYEVALPVTQAPRADGAFNLDVPNWNGYQAKGPTLGWRDYYRIGK